MCGNFCSSNQCLIAHFGNQNVAQGAKKTSSSGDKLSSMEDHGIAEINTEGGGELYTTIWTIEILPWEPIFDVMP